ncbi:DUF1064 domain-containing protein [Paramuribaculum intestinale]|uniref:DUF1064 domain-containing protein n=1 Tax=Paramuribaculum intestinale TaxID=2094151 RepID=UPI0025B1CF37|nr:DUF1064 domain-containing protein [Paramuribaculum intestinale]
MNTDDSMTSAEFRALVAERKASTTHKRSKYGARRTADGYASRREQARARQISDLQEQVPFQLIPPQRDALGQSVRPCSYIADFVYRDAEGRLVVEDAKGYPTPEYRIKKKLMLHVHGITVREV